jgi:hypothetical protein
LSPSSPILTGLKFWRAIAGNVGPTLTVTVALGAAGLAITARTHGKPFWAGVVVAIAGGIGALLTLAVALTRSVKSREFRDALGRAFEEGEDIPDLTATPSWWCRG